MCTAVFTSRVEARIGRDAALRPAVPAAAQACAPSALRLAAAVRAAVERGWPSAGIRLLLAGCAPVAVHTLAREAARVRFRLPVVARATVGAGRRRSLACVVLAVAAKPAGLALAPVHELARCAGVVHAARAVLARLAQAGRCLGAVLAGPAVLAAAAVCAYAVHARAVRTARRRCALVHVVLAVLALVPNHAAAAVCKVQVVARRAVHTRPARALIHVDLALRPDETSVAHAATVELARPVLATVHALALCARVAGRAGAHVAAGPSGGELRVRRPVLRLHVRGVEAGSTIAAGAAGALVDVGTLCPRPAVLADAVTILAPAVLAAAGGIVAARIRPSAGTIDALCTGTAPHDHRPRARIWRRATGRSTVPVGAGARASDAGAVRRAALAVRAALCRAQRQRANRDPEQRW
jgi:hypothetical protein